MPVNRSILTSVPDECRKCQGRCCRGLVGIGVVLLVGPDDIKRWLGVDELTSEAIIEGVNSGKLPIVFQEIDASTVYIDGLTTWIARMQLASDDDRVVCEFGRKYRLNSPCVMWDNEKTECKYDWGDRPKNCRLLERSAQGADVLYASERCRFFTRNYSLATNAREWLPYRTKINKVMRYYGQHRRPF